MNKQKLSLWLLIGILLSSPLLSAYSPPAITGSLCGFFTTKTVIDPQGMRWDVFVFITCADGEVLKVNTGSSALMGSYVRAYDVEIQDTPAAVMEDGTVIYRTITNWSNYDLISGCGDCAAQPPAPPPDEWYRQISSICGWIENGSSTGALTPYISEWDTGATYDLTMLEPDYMNWLLNLGMPGYFWVYEAVLDMRMIIRFSSIEKVDSCQPSAPAPVPVLTAPVFIYPSEWQELDYEGDYLFKVETVPGAAEYVWVFSQNGSYIWDSTRDLQERGWDEYGIQAQDEAHSLFVPGELEVDVYAVVNGQPTPTGERRVYLVQRATPAPAVEPGEVQGWLDEKRVLASNLENITIPTRIFSVPAFRAYDESYARSLLDEFQARLGAGSLSIEDYERLQRLTIQERFLTEMLYHYVDTTTTVSKSTVDSIKTVLTYHNALKKVWDRCGGFACGALQKAANRLAWDIIRSYGKQFIRLGTQTVASREQLEVVWEAGLVMVQNLVDKTASPIEILYDTGAEYALTSALFLPYLERTQVLINRGVTTAYDPNHGDAFPLSGDTDRASSLTSELAQKASWESDLSISWYQDFEKTADIAGIFQEITDMASMVNPLMAAVSAGARLEKVALNTVLGTINYKNMGCIEYLASRGAEIAFNAQQPAEDCRYWEGAYQIPSSIRSSTRKLAAYHKSPLESALQQETLEYQDALNRLSMVIAAGDMTAAQTELERFILSQEALSASLGRSQAVLEAQDQVSDEGAAVVAQTSAFNFDNLVLYLSLAETLTAVENGRQPESDLQQASNQAVQRLNEVNAVLQNVDLNPPQGTPLIVVKQAEFAAQGGGPASISVTIQNLGDAPAPEVTIYLDPGGPAPQSQTRVMPAGWEELVVFDAAPEGQAFYTIKVYVSGEMVDMYLVDAERRIPASEALPIAATPEIAAAVEVPPVQTSYGGSYGLVCIALIAAGGAALLVVLFKRKRPKQDQKRR